MRQASCLHGVLMTLVYSNAALQYWLQRGNLAVDSQLLSGNLIPH
jgi:hypothetical protein